MHRFIPPICLLVVLLVASCKPSGLALHEGGVSAGRPAFSLAVPAGFQALAGGATTASVPADFPLRPSAQVSYALFAGGAENPNALLHVMTVTLPSPAWRFAMESDKESDDIGFAKEKRDGRFLTLRTRVLLADNDWFCALATQNGRKPAGLMLARRLSFTPDIHTRVVMEYREPAPACVDEYTAGAIVAGRLPMRGPISGECGRAIDAFAKRADALLLVGNPTDSPRTPAPKGSLPAFAPDLGVLCGTAENVERDDPDYDRP